MLVVVAFLAPAVRVARADVGGEFVDDPELSEATEAIDSPDERTRPTEVTPEMPRAILPAAEPVTRPWRRQANAAVAHGEVFFQGSPLGYVSSDGREDFDAFARIGPGVSRTGARTVFGAFAAYEVSRMSTSTFGAHAMLRSRRTGWGGGLGALVDTGGHVGGSVAGCWRAACLEVQLRDHPDRGRTFATWLRLTIPILEIAHELTDRNRTE